VEETVSLYARLPSAACKLAVELDHGLLEHAVTYRQHVIAAGNIERHCVRHQGCEFLRRTCNIVLGPDTDKGRGLDTGHIFAVHEIARTPDAGCKSGLVAPGLIGESPEHPPALVRDLVN